MKRIVCEWSGPPVKGLAVTILHFPDTKTDIVSTCTSFFEALGTELGSNVTVTIPSSGDVLSPATGTLTGAWSEAGGGGQAVGNTGDVAAAGVGACINWLTSDVVNGKRVRGRTFVVPMAVGRYAEDGTLAVGSAQAIEDAAGILVTGGLLVWHRPTIPGASDGSEHEVIDAVVRDKVAFLSSRRD